MRDRTNLRVLATAKARSVGFAAAFAVSGLGATGALEWFSHSDAPWME